MGGGFLPSIANQEARPYSEPSEPEDSLDYVSVDKAEESATDDDVRENYSDFMKELEMSEESD